jgi:hypothetical protein
MPFRPYSLISSVSTAGRPVSVGGYGHVRHGAAVADAVAFRTYQRLSPLLCNVFVLLNVELNGLPERRMWRARTVLRCR